MRLRPTTEHCVGARMRCGMKGYPPTRTNREMFEDVALPRMEHARERQIVISEGDRDLVDETRNVTNGG